MPMGNPLQRYDEDTAQAVERNRLDLHITGTPTSMAASLIAGLVTTGLVWGTIPAAACGGGLAMLLLVLALRMTVRHWHMRYPGRWSVRGWLRWYRGAYLMHGLMWGALVPAIVPGTPPDVLAAVVIMIAAMTGGSLFTSAFDLRAALLFGVSAAGPMFVQLGIGVDGMPTHRLAVAAATFIGIMLVVARRVAELTQRQVLAQLAEQRHLAQIERHARESDAAREVLARARDEAEQANRAKSQFLAQMSHELRTPLNAIAGFGQILERDRDPPLSPRQREHVGHILRAGGHLLELINDLLDLGRIEAGRITLDVVRVPVRGLVEECLSEVRALAEARSIVLGDHIEGLDGSTPDLRADRTRTRQVLLNLLGNAIKYTEAGGTITVGCRQDGELLVLAVRDTGCGLSAEQLPRLFQPFERLGAERGTVEGTGIGLYLSRRLVQAMGGRMGVASVAGVGSTFWFSLPALPREEAPAPAAPHPRGDSAEPAGAGGCARVVCVDDNPVNLAVLEGMLAQQGGMAVAGTVDPSAGLQMVRQQQPQLVLVDLRMPGMDGFEFFARLQQDPATARIPVVAVSAHAQPADIERAMAVGFHGYLTKPVSAEQLTAQVASATGSRLPARPGIGTP